MDAFAASLKKVEQKGEKETDNLEKTIDEKMCKAMEQLEVLNVMINQVNGVIGPKAKENDPDNDYQDISAFIRKHH